MKVPNFGYHLARAEGRMIRAAYAAALNTKVRPAVTVTKALSCDVCSYSGAATLPEQVASIRSFLHHAGRPHRFVVFSDGTYSKRETELLQRIDSCIEVSEIPRTQVTVEGTRGYLENHPTGRQLALMMTLPLERATLYFDSDVLFFRGAAQLETYLSTVPNAAALYLPDCQLAADERLFRCGEQRAQPVNTGMIYLRRKLDWSVALERLRELNGHPKFHTNQTLTQLAMHANGAAPLDATKFVLQLDDQFIYRDLYSRREIVARHYVNPVRHKFWRAVLR